MGRRKSKSKSTKPRRAWRIPRFRVALRTLATPFGMAAAKLNAQSLHRVSIGMAWTAAIIAIIGAWMLGVPRLQAFASQDRYSGTTNVRFIDPPRWFNGELEQRMLQTAEMHLDGDPMRRDDLVACREALLATGWFESISQVRRTAPDQVEVEAQFARPYAVVRDGDGDHLVDVVGRLLPLKYELGARTSFIAITGAHFARPQRCGEVWEGADVIAALRLLNVIDQQPWRNQVTHVDVTNHVNGEPIRLRTDNDSSVIWGNAPGEEAALEVLAENKLMRLNFLFKTYKRIDAGETGGELDITNEKAVLTR